jgi:hypothetical protein
MDLRSWCRPLRVRLAAAIVTSVFSEYSEGIRFFFLRNAAAIFRNLNKPPGESS